ncbi:putative RNA polymerase beta subunit [Pseudomonas phage Phabio]|uniref:Putative RNA polymerase beta subunit n=1 Tax=Pseudomonas phage Phabio TaxID=2006668 RepID=A0A1Y0SWA3_9CAUD|nr:RNA polymerase beta subunit [Pseudomonas phage Phabio]ARV76755.1 putative RNA polymerase beta subunit [Pseudomonas phage Phabio]
MGPKMKLRDFFLLGVKAGMGRKRAWMNLLFNVVYESNLKRPIMYQPHIENDEMYFYMPDSNEKIYIEDYIPGRAPLHFLDEFILKAGDLSNYPEGPDIRTTYGNVFTNQMCLIETVGNAFPFQTGVFPAAKLGGLILENAVDNREDGDTTTFHPEPGKFYIWQYTKFCEYCMALPGYADGLVTSTTRASLQGNDDWFAVRDKWIKDNHDRLTDPAAVAELSVIADKMDDEYLKDDESFLYYKSKKKLAGCRRKLHYFFGGESPFSDGTTVELIAKSLEEGLDMDKLPVMNNSLRFGSYNRGSQTALGGESTKTIYRMVGTIRIVEHDCKTWLGTPVMVTKFNGKGFIGYTYIEDGHNILITKDNLNDIMGRKVNLRGPMTCKTGRDPSSGLIGTGRNICAVCAGSDLAENPHAVPAATAGVGGRFLSVFMSKMHSSTLTTVKWDMHRRLS